MSKLHSFCGYCGAEFAEKIKYPRQCFRCNKDTYHNPASAIVVIIPVHHWDNKRLLGYLVQQRAIEPEKGGWAFPSGFIEFGETWQQATVRELQEEMGVSIKPEDLSLLEIKNDSKNNLLIFSHHSGINEDDIHFSPNLEVLDYKLVSNPSQLRLCFPTHDEVFEHYYINYANGFIAPRLA